jgi:hypothetical protein
MTNYKSNYLQIQVDVSFEKRPEFINTQSLMDYSM